MAMASISNASVAEDSLEGADSHRNLPFTVESLNRKKDAEVALFKEKGKITDEEVEAVLMRVLDSKRGYLIKRLEAILQKRDPEEADLIRNQYKILAQQMENERLAQQAVDEATKAEENEITDR